MGPYLQVFITTPDRATADTLARRLVDSALAACVQVLGPIASTYRWKGRVESAEEWLCIAKTDQARFPELEQLVVSAHPYDTPEILAVPVVAASARYLAWLGDALSDRS